MTRLSLRLFVTGYSQRSARAIEAIRILNKDHLNNSLEITIVDVLEHPDLAEENKILATPTLICETPGAPRRLVGDLGDVERIAQLLGLKDHPGPNETK